MTDRPLLVLLPGGGEGVTYPGLEVDWFVRGTRWGLCRCGRRTRGRRVVEQKNGTRSQSACHRCWLDHDIRMLEPVKGRGA